MGNPRLSIIIPIHNEEKYVLHTLDSLMEQRDFNNQKFANNIFQVIIVANGCTDRSIELIENFSENNSYFGISLITKQDKSVVAARIAGYNFVISNEKYKTDILASADGDVLFHRNWVANVIKKFDQEGFDLMSNAGCFPLSFWQKVPNLVEKYLDEVGTIFFDKETIDWLDIRGNKYLFTEKVFFDFIRLATDQCFAVSCKAYIAVGGYTLDYLDAEKRIELADEGGRLSAKIERTEAKIIYSNEAPYTASPRRALNDVERFLGGNMYNQGFTQRNYRIYNSDNYAKLNEMALYTDHTGIRKYILKNYIILKCITRPALIGRNPAYFGNCSAEIENEINNWWQKVVLLKSGREAIDFAQVLTDKYYDRLIALMPKQVVL
ncbi:MAG: glycosyl transferase family 2 protein [uncultured bacterium]|nr:MAG: glycosyl transferase family 2 protein [uncultured bacterium]